jgi:ectoine hydroxylase-related dioxygenase (phytanoyl-CoA dioxygenase family)
MSTPWIESPFFEELIKNSDYTTDEKDLLYEFNRNGYIILENVITDEECDNIIKDIQTSLDKQEFKKQDERYEYSNSPRVFEAWKTSPHVLNLAKNKKILSTLELIYGRKAFPFQTINFKQSTSQPLHSDGIHFQTIPYNWMVGTWTALEDVNVTSTGTLKYVPGSHKWPFYQFPDLNVPVPENRGDQFEAYAEYENFLVQLIQSKGALQKVFNAKKGSTLIWAANLLHGGTPTAVEGRTRWSQATHYYFEGCEEYYCPLFSNWYKGDWAIKNMESKDILNHKIEI